MRGVARTIGASLATVQRHFPTKDELWRGAIDDVLDGFSDPTLSKFDRSLARSIEELLGRGRSHPGLIARLFTDQSPGHLERHEYLAGRLANRHDRSRAFVAEQQDGHVVRDIDLSALFLLLTIGVGAVAGAPTAARDIYGFDLDDHLDRKRLAERLADILTLGILER